MLTALMVLLRSIGLICGGHRAIVLENLALRQQLAVLTRTVKRPQLRSTDRLFWILRTEACRGPAPERRGSARYENRREFQFGWNVRRATTNSAACQHSIDDAQPCAVECLPPNKSAS